MLPTTGGLLREFLRVTVGVTRDTGGLGTPMLAERAKRATQPATIMTGCANKDQIVKVTNFISGPVLPSSHSGEFEDIGSRASGWLSELQYFRPQTKHLPGVFRGEGGQDW